MYVQGPGSNPQYHLHSKPNQPTKTQLKTEPGPQFHKAQLGFSRQTLNTPIAVNQLQAVANALLSPSTEMSSVQQKAEQQRAAGGGRVSKFRGTLDRITATKGY